MCGMMYSQKSPGWLRAVQIGLGAITIALSIFALAFSVHWIIFIGIAFLVNGIARIIQGFSGKRSGASRAFLVGVGILAIALSAAVLTSPLFFGARLAGIIIAIGILITGIQMVFRGIRGRYAQIRSSDIADK